MKSQDRTKPATKKRGAARNDKGQFEPLSPHEDPELLDQLVRLVRAVRDIQPMVAATVLAFKQLGKVCKTSATAHGYETVTA